MEFASISELLGKTLSSIEINGENDVMIFTLNDGIQYQLYHDQDCCEMVKIEDINGYLDDILSTPITYAEEVSNNEMNKPNESSESWTWTFYKFATVKGWVTIRWLGESNGYYSESVNFVKL